MSDLEMTPNQDIWLSESELRDYLDYSYSTLTRLRKRGLPSIGQYRLRRYHVATVMQWLAEHA